MLSDVREGFAQAQRELPPTWFYDEVGSELFERITRLPEYYPTRAEREILAHRAGWIAARTMPGTLAELGAGSAAKTRVLLSALRAAGACELYIPLDVAAGALEETARTLRREYPGLRVAPIVADMRDDPSLPRLRPAPVLYAFLGSTIGNFAPAAARQLLARIRATLHPGDALLLGTDLVKDPRVLLAAYDDAEGVTSEFNLNVLRVLNRELGADFPIDAFAHEARWVGEARRIEMHLVATREVTVRVPGAGEYAFRRGDSIRTEVSCKYDRPQVEAMLHGAGFAPGAWMTDRAGAFALSLARVTA